MPLPLITFQGPIITDLNKQRAVVDYLKWMDNAQINEHLNKTKNNFGILMVNIDYDNNTGNIVRTANAMGAIEVVLYGRKKFDRRSSMGTEFYMNFRQIKLLEEIHEVFKDYELIVGLDNIEGSVNMFDYDWGKTSLGRGKNHPVSFAATPQEENFTHYQKIVSEATPCQRGQSDSDGGFILPKTLLCLGQESIGLPKEVIAKCDKLVHIPQYGSVRSLNVATAAGIAMYDYVRKLVKK